jgi:hypothetical protein
LEKEIMDKDQVAPPNYGEVKKFPRLVGGVDRRWLDEQLWIENPTLLVQVGLTD